MDPEVMFVGEAPGRREDAAGRPFVGAAGRFFDELLASVQLHRERVFITNAVKSRPTDRPDGPNRAPRRPEIEACAPWLDQQLALIRPRLVVTMGGVALAHFRRDAKISQVHGTPFAHGDLTVLPLFHPAAALHGDLRGVLRRDFRAVRRALNATSRSAGPMQAGGPRRSVGPSRRRRP